MSDKSKTVEDKMNELREITAWFDSEDFSLTKATEKFQAASKLATDIEEDLKEFENQITVLKQSFEDA